MRKTSETLEEKARRLVIDTAKRAPNEPIPKIVERQIALTLDQIARFRSLHEKLSDSLQMMKCYTTTELIRMEDRTPKYSFYRFPEREKLQRSLLRIEQERRRLMITKEEKLQDLHNELLSLLNKHAQLHPPNNGH